MSGLNLYSIPSRNQDQSTDSIASVTHPTTEQPQQIMQIEDSHAAKEERAALMHTEGEDQRREAARSGGPRSWRTRETEKENTLMTPPHREVTTPEAVATQNESFVRIAIMREQNRLAQAREDALAEARISILHEESKQKLAREKEIHDEKMRALLNESGIHLEIAKEDRRYNSELWQERIAQCRHEEYFRRS